MPSRLICRGLHGTKSRSTALNQLIGKLTKVLPILKQDNAMSASLLSLRLDKGRSAHSVVQVPDDVGSCVSAWEHQCGQH